MSDESKPKKISRRKFISGVGSGVAGTYVLFPALQQSSMAGQKSPVEQNGKPELLQLKVNGRQVKLHVEPQTTLAELLRNRLQLTGTKIICNHGECGGCTVLMNGKAVYACHLLALDAADKEITTIEGLLKEEKLHPLQEAFVEKDGLQCGYCTPGQVMAAYVLLKENPRPTKEQVMKGMSGNLCRCGAYPKIIDSVLAAAEKWNG